MLTGWGQQGRLFLRWNRRSADAMFLLLFSRSVFLPALCDPMDSVAHQAPLSMDSPGKNTGVGCRFLLQEILTQGLTLTFPASAGRFFTTEPADAVEGIRVVDTV